MLKNLLSSFFLLLWKWNKTSSPDFTYLLKISPLCLRLD